MEKTLGECEKVHTGSLDDTGSVRTGVVRETTSVGDSLGHWKCLMLEII
jgi:hypothetical protein